MDGSRASKLSAFSYYLRTGRRLPEPLETKFNPYHDPENGQFTFGPGGPRSLATGAISHDRHLSTRVASGRLNDRSARATSGKSSIQNRLGVLSEKYETGGRGPATVSPGAGDPGGVSYGSYQFSSKKGTAAAFIKSPEARPWSREFNSLVAGTSAFSDQWKKVAARDPIGFFAAQHGYIQRTHYDPVVKAVKSASGYDLDTASDAVRNATWSTAVQHGQAAAILSRAVAVTDKQTTRGSVSYQSELVDNIYTQRIAYVGRLRNAALKKNDQGAARIFASAIDRYRKERQDAQAMLSTEK